MALKTGTVVEFNNGVTGYERARVLQNNPKDGYTLVVEDDSGETVWVETEHLLVVHAETLAAEKAWEGR